MNSKSSSCINCGETVNTAFCPTCGQKNPPKKINALTLYTDFQSRIYGLDGMVPRTLIDLTMRPGKVAKSFIDGNRVKYVGPVGYFFLTITLFLLVMSWLDVNFYEYGMSNNPFVTEGSSKQMQLAEQIMGFINRNQRIFSFLIIPITGFWIRIFFRKSGYNYLECMVPAFYVMGHAEWISILSLVTFGFFGFAFFIIQIPISILLLAVACVELFPYNKPVKAFLKGAVVSIVSFVSFQVLIILAASVYIAFNPELLKMVR